MKGRLYRLFAEILEYPTPGLASRVQEILALLEPQNSRAGQFLRAFASFLDGASPGRVEEIYTRTFDLDSPCPPYLGYQLLGGDHRRAIFMSRLNAHYLAHGFAPGVELPDHLAVILRFIAGRAKEEEELIRECLLPALARMADQCPPENPYRGILESLMLILPLPAAENGGAP